MNREQALYYPIDTSWGKLHLHINYEDGRITKVFLNMPPIGTELSMMAQLTGILITKYAEIGGDPLNLVKHLQSIKFGTPSFYAGNQIDSIPHAIAFCMKKTAEDVGIKEEKNSDVVLETAGSET